MRKLTPLEWGPPQEGSALGLVLLGNRASRPTEVGNKVAAL
jgi:hypothetical protein